MSQQTQENSMSQYRCTQCGELYGSDEYNGLELVRVDKENPSRGNERVCRECGARFHSEKWQLVDEVEVNGDTFHISTVGLTIGHGLNHDQWFETLVTPSGGSEWMDRYETQEEAEAGHEEVIERLEAGEYSFVPTGKRLVMGEEQ